MNCQTLFSQKLKKCQLFLPAAVMICVLRSNIWACTGDFGIDGICSKLPADVSSRLEVYIFGLSIWYLSVLCIQAGKVPDSLHIGAGSPEPSLINNVVSTKIHVSGGQNQWKLIKIEIYIVKR